MTSELQDSHHQNWTPRPSGQMRSFVYWSFFASICTPLILNILLVQDKFTVFLLALIGLPLAAIAAFVLTAFIMAPIYALQLKLMDQNYGERGRPNGPQNLLNRHPEMQINVLEKCSKALLGPLLLQYIAMHLPSEISEIKRLARNGRISDLAMESVKKDLFRHLSHQLKSPMALLKAHSEAAQVKLACKDYLAVNKNMVEIEHITMNVAGLVEQMLSMAWVESLSELGVDHKKVNLSKSLMRVERLHLMAAEEKSISLQSEVMAGLWVAGEEQLLQEMVASLLDNAIQYSPVGSVIKLSAFAVANTKAIAVVVTDQGPGIPDAERDRVFDPFYGCLSPNAEGNMTFGTRRHRVITEGVARSSHGLGLSLVRSIARLHSSEIALSSGPDGVGLCVRIILNASAPPEATN